MGTLSHPEYAEQRLTSKIRTHPTDAGYLKMAEVWYRKSSVIPPCLIYHQERLSCKEPLPEDRADSL
jgi:hypothetical protein